MICRTSQHKDQSQIKIKFDLLTLQKNITAVETKSNLICLTSQETPNNTNIKSNLILYFTTDFYKAAVSGIHLGQSKVAW